MYRLTERLARAEAIVAQLAADEPPADKLWADTRCHRLGNLFRRVASRLRREDRSAEGERFDRWAVGLAAVGDEATAMTVLARLRRAAHAPLA